VDQSPADEPAPSPVRATPETPIAAPSMTSDGLCDSTVRLDLTPVNQPPPTEEESVLDVDSPSEIDAVTDDISAEMATTVPVKYASDTSIPVPTVTASKETISPAGSQVRSFGQLDKCLLQFVCAHHSDPDR